MTDKDRNTCCPNGVTGRKVQYMNIEQKTHAGREILWALPANTRRALDLSYGDYVATCSRLSPIEAAYAIYCAGFYSGTEYRRDKCDAWSSGKEQAE